MRTETIYVGRSAEATKLLNNLKPRMISRRAEIKIALRSARKASLWIFSSEHYVYEMLKSLSLPLDRRLGDMIVMDKIEPCLAVTLSEFFNSVVYRQPAGSYLPLPELVEVLDTDNRPDLAIGGILDMNAGLLTLWRGDLTKLVVPLSTFNPNSSGASPDFREFRIVDYGQTLQFGEYEAAFDTVLYEYDSEYRKRLNKKRRKEERSLGASIRRLRLQRRLKRRDLAPLSEKTVARIERNEVKRIQKRTLQTLSDRLAVPIEELGGF